MKSLCRLALAAMINLILFSSACQEQAPDENISILIASARIVGPPIVAFPSIGDLWMSTWADDDNIYITWGDGSGPGHTWGDPYIEEFGTDAGVRS